jgi:hypothetical protein
VIITPEVVRPIPGAQPAPELKYPEPFMKENSAVPMQQPGIDKTGPVTEGPKLENIRVEQLVQPQKQGQATPAPNQEAAPAQKPATNPATNPGQAAPPGSGAGGNQE